MNALTTAPALGAAISLDGLIGLFDLLEGGLAFVAAGTGRLVYLNPTLAGWILSASDEPSDRALERILSRSVALRMAIERLRAGEASFEFIADVCFEASDVRADVQLTTLEIGGERLVALVAGRVDLERLGVADRRDPLTGLADRGELFDRLRSRLPPKCGDRDNFTLLFIDLDDFKRVNDEFGHLDGDRVLVEVSRRFIQSVRMGDLVARFGGDEFVVILERARSWEEYWPVIRRIEAAIAAPIVLAHGAVNLTASVGAAEAHGHADTPDALIAAADRAMYAVKRRKAMRLDAAARPAGKARGQRCG